LRRPICITDQLDAIPGLEGREAMRLRTQIETFEYRWRRCIAVPTAVMRGLYRLLPAGGLLVWLALLLITHQVHFISGPGAAAAGTALSAAVATALAVTLFSISARAFVALFFATAVFETAVAEGYDNRVLPTSGWWSWVVLGLAAVPAILEGGLAAAVVMNELWWAAMHRLIRKDCLLAVLDELLVVLDDLRAPSGCRQLAQRLKRARNLEFAARMFTRDLLPAYLVGYLRSGDWLTQRAEGWAEALRHMQRQVLTPVPGSRTKMEAALAHEIRCLVTGDLGALAWRKPPPRPPRRAVLWRQAITVVRTILVAALPLAAVLAAQPVLHTSPGLFGWARIATATWALLYVVLSLDPAIRDKIDTANQVLGTLRNAR
jgi:hypothetical protein